MLFHLDEIKAYTLCLKNFWIWQNIGNVYALRGKIDLNSMVIKTLFLLTQHVFRLPGVK